MKRVKQFVLIACIIIIGIIQSTPSIGDATTPCYRFIGGKEAYINGVYTITCTGGDFITCIIPCPQR